MSRSISFGSRSFPGCVPPESRCIPCSGSSGKTSVDSSHGGIKLVSDVKFLSLRHGCSRTTCHLVSDMKFLSSRHASCRTTFLCNASPSNYRRNSDYSRQKKHGYSQNGKRPTAEKGGYEDLEESETYSSKNGSLISTSGNQKFQATAAPGPREKKIVELFRKVQAKLRERESMKEEKRVADPQGKGKQNGNVDSLLKLLRKHSVQQGKNTNSAINKEFILDEPEPIGPSIQERNTNSLDSNSRVKKHEMQEGQGPHHSRPKSNFQKRSPVPKVKFQSVYSHNSPNHVSQDNLDDTTKGVGTDSESYLVPTFSEEIVCDEIEDETSEIYGIEHEHDTGAEEQFEVEAINLSRMKLSETSEIYGIEHEHDTGAEEQFEVEAINLSRMKLSELRALARSRGLKGFSKLKKNELVGLLSAN